MKAKNFVTKFTTQMQQKAKYYYGEDWKRGVSGFKMFWSKIKLSRYVNKDIFRRSLKFKYMFSSDHRTVGCRWSSTKINNKQERLGGSFHCIVHSERVEHFQQWGS